jgi:CDP-diglyceride synthetase
MVKRHHGIKDFSGMLGPVGGMLDRLDSLIGAGWIFLIFLKTIH